MTTLDETIDYLQGEWVSAKDGYEAGNSFSDWLALKLSENRAALERERAELTAACVSVSRMGARALEQELRANNLQAALERARALAETWAAMKYNGDLTAAVYHGCADELADALGSGGAA